MAKFRICPSCGQVIPRVTEPGATRKWAVVYPKLHPDVVAAIYKDPRKRTYIAKDRDLPVRLVGKIKDCKTLEDALVNHGFRWGRHSLAFVRAHHA